MVVLAPGIKYMLAPDINFLGNLIMASSDDTNTVDPKLLEILVCPLTKGPLDYDASAQELISKRAGLAYPIRDGIPVMLADEARKLDDA
jgi:uncharacterized protein YbaR (Trm112 family)